MVAPRRDLPDLPALVRRRRRRRHRRPARHHRAPALPARPRRRRRLALARSTPRRRHDAGYDVADYRDVDPLFGTLADADAMLAQRPRARPQGHRRPGAQPHLRRARVVPGGAGRRPRQPRARALHLPRRPRRRRRAAAEQLGVGLRRPGWTRVTEADGTRPVVPAPLRHQAARLQLGAPRGRAPSSSRSCGSGSTAASTASGSTSPTAWSRRRACPTGRAGPATLLDEAPPRRATPPRRADVGPGRRARDLPAWRAILDAYAGPTGSCAPRRGSSRRSALARYVRPDEMHQAFNFDYLDAHWDAADLRTVIDGLAARPTTRSAPRPPGCCPTTTSCGTPPGSACRSGTPRPNGIRADDPQPDAELGLRRARAATALMLALPGGAYLYQGEELGLPEPPTCRDDVPPGPDLPAHRRRRRPAATAAGCRCRGSERRPVARLRPGRQDLAAAARRLRRLRRRPAGRRRGLDARAVPGPAAPAPRARARHGRLALGRGLSPTTSSPWRNTAADGERRPLVVANLGAEPGRPARRPEVLVASGPADRRRASCPTDTTVWATR